MDDDAQSPRRTDGGDRDDEDAPSGGYVHEPAVDHDTWQSVTGGSDADADEVATADPERTAGAGPDARDRGPDGSEDDTPQSVTDWRAGRDRGPESPRGRSRSPQDGGTGPGDTTRRGPPTDRQPPTDGASAGRTRSDGQPDGAAPEGARPERRQQPPRGPDDRAGQSGHPGQPAQPDTPPGGEPEESPGDEPRSADWDDARGREGDEEAEAAAAPALAADPDDAVVSAVTTAVGTHLAVGLGAALLVVVLGILSRPMFGRRDAIDPVYLVDGEVLIHALPALALALAAGTGLYVASRRRAAGGLTEAAPTDYARAVAPGAAVGAGLGSLALTVLVVGAAALLLDPFLSFQPLNFLLVAVVLAVTAAVVAALAAVATGLAPDQTPLRSSNSS